MSVWSGSAYAGEKKEEWFQGKGKYKFPSGVVYEGEFFKGQFHGEGVMIYPNGGRYVAKWEHGKLLSGEYFFFDDLKFETENWDYCVGEDRQFNYERHNGILPAGQTLMTNDPKGEKVIPQGTYGKLQCHFELNYLES